MADAIHEAMVRGWPDSSFRTIKWALVEAARSGSDTRLYAAYLLEGMRKDPKHPGAVESRTREKFADANARKVKLPEPEYSGAFTVSVSPARKAVGTPAPLPKDWRRVPPPPPPRPGQLPERPRCWPTPEHAARTYRGPPNRCGRLSHVGC